MSRVTTSCSAPCGTPETVGPCTRRVTAEASAHAAFPVPTLSTSAFAAHGGTPRRQAIATTGPQTPPCSSETLKGLKTCSERTGRVSRHDAGCPWYLSPLGAESHIPFVAKILVFAYKVPTTMSHNMRYIHEFHSKTSEIPNSKTPQAPRLAKDCYVTTGQALAERATNKALYWPGDNSTLAVKSRCTYAFGLPPF